MKRPHLNWSNRTHRFPPWAFWTGEVKNLSLKNSREPQNTTRALFLACRADTSRVFLPTACGYCQTRCRHCQFTKCPEERMDLMREVRSYLSDLVIRVVTVSCRRGSQNFKHKRVVLVRDDAAKKKLIHISRNLKNTSVRVLCLPRHTLHP